MPEWIAHLIIGFIIADLISEKKSLVMIGAILPDLLSKLNLILRNFLDPQTIALSIGYAHTPFACLLFSISFLPFFEEKKTKILLLLSLGWISHFILDLIQGPFGYSLLWPFSFQELGLKLFYSDSFIPTATALFLLLIYLLIKKIKILNS